MRLARSGRNWCNFFPNTSTRCYYNQVTQQTEPLTDPVHENGCLLLSEVSKIFEQCKATLAHQNHVNLSLYFGRAVFVAFNTVRLFPRYLTAVMTFITFKWGTAPIRVKYVWKRINGLNRFSKSTLESIITITINQNGHRYDLNRLASIPLNKFNCRSFRLH